MIHHIQLYQIESRIINLKYVVSVYHGPTGFVINLGADHQYDYDNLHYDKFLEAWKEYLNWRN